MQHDKNDFLLIDKYRKLIYAQIYAHLEMIRVASIAQIKNQNKYPAEVRVMKVR